MYDPDRHAAGDVNDVEQRMGEAAYRRFGKAADVPLRANGDKSRDLTFAASTTGPIFGPEDDTITDNTSTAGRVTPGTPTTSRIDYFGDQDWFRATLEAGVGYTISVEGSGDDPAFQLFLSVYSSSGNLITTSPTGGPRGFPFLDGFASAGNVFIGIGSSSTSPLTLGQYTIRIDRMIDTIGDDIWTTSTLGVGNTVSSTIDRTDDRDWFRTELVAGQVYLVEMYPTPFYNGQLFDPKIAIYDAQGQLYATLDTGPANRTGYLFEADRTGTFFIESSIWGHRVGSYTLSLEYDPSSRIDTLATLAPGEEAHGLIHSVEDTDWFRVELSAGVTYEFRTGDLDFTNTLRVLNAAGNEVAYGGTGYETIILFTPVISGTYYLEIDGFFAQFGYYGGLAYDRIDIDDDTIAGNTSSTTTLALGATLTAALEYYSDEDWVKVQVESGKSYVATLTPTDIDNRLELGRIAVFRENGFAFQYGDTHSTGFEADSTGVMFLDVFRARGGTPGGYTLTFHEEINGSVNTRANLVIDGPAQSSRLDFRADQDWFRVTLQAGQSYAIAVEPSSEDSQLFRPNIMINDATGAFILDNPFDPFSAGGTANHLIFTATTTGVHYISVFHNGGGQWDTGYSVAIDRLNTGVDAFAADASTTGVITTAAPVTSTLDHIADEDWIAFNVVAGQYYTLTLVGAGGSTMEGATLTARIPSGSVGSGVIGEDGVARFTFLAESTATLHAAIGGAELGLTGSYRLTLTSASTSADLIAHDDTTNATITVGESIDSSLDYVTDRDWFRISLTEGEYYSFIAASAADDGFVDANYIIELYSSDGALLHSHERHDNHPDAFLAEASGDYFVSIRNRFNGAQGDYTLTVAEASPVADLQIGALEPGDGVWRLYFTGIGESVTPADNGHSDYSIGWSDAQIATIVAAWNTFAQYIDIRIELTTDIAAADCIYLMTPDSLTNDLVQPILGDASVWKIGLDGDVFGPEFGGGAPGTAGWSYLLSMIGHQLGLGSGGMFAGVDPDYGGFGAGWLNQGVYTVMQSYHGQPGWQTGWMFNPDVPAHGYQASPMALDVAALQAMYGANATANAGDSTFNFTSLSAGIFLSIWDTGGVDTITAAAFAAGAVIDLREATLQYEAGGGGYISYLRGITGGFTIAAGAVIENATGSSGADTLIGNNVGNTLRGGDGNDTLSGNAGDDVLNGGAGADVLNGGDGVDVIDYSDSTSAVVAHLLTGSVAGGHAVGDTYSNIEGVIGSNFGDALNGDDSANRLNGGGGNDSLIGNGGADLLEGGDGFDTASYSASDVAVSVNLASGLGTGGDAEGDVLIGVEALYGSAYNDTLIGDAGANSIKGWRGADVIDGGAGEDWADYSNSGAVSVSLLTGLGSGGHAAGDVLSNIENLLGSGFNDTLTGSAGANRLSGEAGDDTLLGDAGDDVLVGGVGADTLNGGAGRDTASYADSNAGVIARLFNNTVQGGHGQGDVLVSIENLIGSAYADSLVGSADAGNTLDGGAGNDSIHGLGGDDHLIGGDGVDRLVGDVGNDILNGGAGADKLEGGAGVDTVIYAGSNAAVSLKLWNQTITGGHAQGDTLSGIENAIGSAFADSLVGADAVANRLEGQDGADYLNGLSGDDALFGGAGVDRLIGGLGADQIDGGEGDADVADYRASNAGVTVRLFSGVATGGHAQGDTLTNIEIVLGSAFADSLLGAYAQADTLDGDVGNDYLNGLSGADVLLGGAGNDRLFGDEGDDLLNGGAGGDALNGGAGRDTIDYSASTAAVTVRLWSGKGIGGHAQGDTYVGVEDVIGSAYADSILGADDVANTLRGGAGNDALLGLSGDDLLEGGAGADALNGGAGRDTADYSASNAAVTVRLWSGKGLGGHAQGDTYVGVEDVIGSAYADTILGADNVANLLEGGGGNDTLFGLSGNDTLNGGAGSDRLSGGAGADFFVFDSPLVGVDVITDFAGDDEIWLDDAIFGLSTGQLAASALTLGAAATQASHRIIYNAATGALLFDADGSGAGVAIQFATLSVSTLSPDDFRIV